MWPVEKNMPSPSVTKLQMLEDVTGLFWLRLAHQSTIQLTHRDPPATQVLTQAHQLLVETLHATPKQSNRMQ